MQDLEYTIILCNSLKGVNRKLNFFINGLNKLSVGYTDTRYSVYIADCIKIRKKINFHIE